MSDFTIRVNAGTTPPLIEVRNGRGAPFFTTNAPLASVPDRQSVAEQIAAALMEKGVDGWRARDELDAAWTAALETEKARQGSAKKTISLGPDEHRVVDETIAALARLDDIYQRGGKLVDIVQTGAECRWFRRDAGARIIRELPESCIRGAITRAARIIKETEKGTYDANPAHWQARQVWTRACYPDVRPLAAVVESPALRPDCSILDTPGYDKASSLLYIPNGAYPPMPTRPTRTDAEEAANELLNLVREFPFSGGAHMGAWLAGLLTVVARPAIAGPCPALLLEASTAGSGKTLLAAILGLIATGREPSASELSDDNEETRKAITAIAIAGERLVCLDNASGIVGSKALDAALTATSWQGRILGKSERTGELPLWTFWIITGNNLLLRGDLHRRVLPCRLEPECERPEERSGFTIPNLRQHVEDNRPNLLVAALTILKAFDLAGRPQGRLPSGEPLPSFGSYEAWSDLIRQAVWWCQGIDVCESRTAVNAESRGDVGLLVAICEGWSELPKGRAEGLTARRALELVKTEPTRFKALREALGEMAKAGQDLPDAHYLGNRLRYARGRVVCGWRLIATEDKKDKVTRWSVERVTAGDWGGIPE